MLLSELKTSRAIVREFLAQNFRMSHDLEGRLRIYHVQQYARSKYGDKHKGTQTIYIVEGKNPINPKQSVVIKEDRLADIYTEDYNVSKQYTHIEELIFLFLAAEDWVEFYDIFSKNEDYFSSIETVEPGDTALYYYILNTITNRMDSVLKERGRVSDYSKN